MQEGFNGHFKRDDGKEFKQCFWQSELRINRGFTDKKNLTEVLRQV
jgi:hypothetical protein